MFSLQGEARHDQRREGSLEDQAVHFAVKQAEAEGGCVTRARGYRSLGYATLPHDETPLDICKDGSRLFIKCTMRRGITSGLDQLGKERASRR
jgi:hypothetical protein